MSVVLPTIKRPSGRKGGVTPTIQVDSRPTSGLPSVSQFARQTGSSVVSGQRCPMTGLSPDSGSRCPMAPVLAVEEKEGRRLSRALSSVNLGDREKRGDRRERAHVDFHECESVSTVRGCKEMSELIYDRDMVNNVFDNSPIGIIVIDKYGTIVTFNQMAKKIYGYDSQDILGKSINILMPSSIAVRHDFYLERALYRIESYLKSVISTELPSVDTSTLSFTDKSFLPYADIVNGSLKKVKLAGGKSRELHGITRSQQQIQSNIKISAVFDKKTADLYYIGYVENITDICSYQERGTAQAKMLRRIVNPSIINRMAKNTLIFDDIKSASVVFCDIVGYTTIANRLTTSQVVQFLHTIFTKFDEIVQRLGAEKIKTIGDCYMAVIGAPVEIEDHANIAIDLGLEFIQAIRLFNNRSEDTSPTEASSLTLDEIPPNSPNYAKQSDLSWMRDITPISVRVGVHSGPLIGGIMSNLRTSYDVTGNTVNIASRLESTAPPDRIRLSEATYQLLRSEHQVECQLQPETEIKGIGKLPTYIYGEVID